MGYKQTRTIPAFAALKKDNEICKYLVKLILCLIEK